MIHSSSYAGFVSEGPKTTRTVPISRTVIKQVRWAVRYNDGCRNCAGEVLGLDGGNRVLLRGKRLIRFLPLPL